MNRSYRSIWNESLGAWVATSEITQAKGKKSRQGRSANRKSDDVSLNSVKSLEPPPALVRSLRTAAALVVGGVATTGGAWAQDSTVNFGNTQGTVCIPSTGMNGNASGTGPAAAFSCTVSLPNGGVSIISGVPGKSDGLPDYVALTNMVGVAKAGANSIAFGDTQTAASGVRSIAIGSKAVASGANSVAVGNATTAASANAMAVGNGASVAAVSASGIAIGERARVGAGTNPAVTANNSIAIGVGSQIGNIWGSSNNSLAIGTSAGVYGSGGVAIGNGALSQWTGVAIGNSAATTESFGLSNYGTNSVAIGDGAKAIAGTRSHADYGATAVGANSSAKAISGVALGVNANASAANAVALGARSVASTEAGVAGYDPGTNAASTNTSPTWSSKLGAVSVGTTSLTRQITNVAAGYADTDAVNIAQLKAAQAAATTHYYSVNDSSTRGTNYNNDGAKSQGALAAGVNSVAMGNSSTAIGDGAKVQKNLVSPTNYWSGDTLGSTAIGARTEISATYTGQPGDDFPTQADASVAVAVGFLSKVTAEGHGYSAATTGAVALGQAANVAAVASTANASAFGGMAFGNTATVQATADTNTNLQSVTADNAIALGNGAIVSASSDVVSSLPITQATASNAIVIGASAKAVTSK